MTRFEKYKTHGYAHATAITVTLGKVTAYENLTHGDDARMVIFDSQGNDVSDKFDAWDLDTFFFLAEEL